MMDVSHFILNDFFDRLSLDQSTNRHVTKENDVLLIERTKNLTKFKNGRIPVCKTLSKMDR
jgi:hypothetical protein